MAWTFRGITRGLEVAENVRDRQQQLTPSRARGVRVRSPPESPPSSHLDFHLTAAWRPAIGASVPWRYSPF